jgi:hypothetical protein
VNEDIYNNDRKKIGYALTFMDKGDVKSWKTAFLQNATTQTILNLGTWADFLEKLKEDFKPYDAPGDALDELITLKMGNSSIEDHIAKFKVLLKKSQVPDDSPSVVLQGPVRRTGMGPRTGLDCNRFEWTNGPGPYNLFEKDRKRPQS